MKPHKHQKYSCGWTDPRSAFNSASVPLEPMHTRTIYFELINEYPYTSTFSQAIAHNDEIHGVINDSLNI